jgi:hypothetical protein
MAEEIKFNGEIWMRIPVTDKSAVSFEQFKEILLKHKPREIWCDHWSSKKPFYVITEYLDEHSFLIICNANSDLTPIAATFEEIYKSIRYGGLADCYFVTEDPLESKSSLKFRKKPDNKIYLPEQFDAANPEAAKGVCGCMAAAKWHVHTIHNNQVCELVDKDWVMPEPDGKHFYPIKPDIFEETYELAE